MGDRHHRDGQAADEGQTRPPLCARASELRTVLASLSRYVFPARKAPASCPLFRVMAHKARSTFLAL